MKNIFKLLSLVIILVIIGAFSTGVHETKLENAYAEPPVDALSFFIADLNAGSNLSIKKKGDYRYVESDGLADHATGRFPNEQNPNAISAQAHKFRMALNPVKKRSPTFVDRSAFGVAINGIPFDATTQGYWNDDASSGWNNEAISNRQDLGLDQNNAHVHPEGAYHYHSIPVALMERGDQYSAAIHLGYAADGFPIYGPFSYKQVQDMNSPLITLSSGYRLKEGDRPNGPEGTYDGTYTADYEYVKGLGDLDQCNGREGVTPEYPRGTYYYVITDSYPYIPRCWFGQPDESFRKEPVKPQGPGKIVKQEDPEEQAENEKEESSNKIDTRKYGIPSRDPVTACRGRRSGTFCSYRTRSLRTINGTCRSYGSYLTCIEIGH